MKSNTSNTFKVMSKEDNKVYTVYDILYKSKTGHPTFLIYKDGQWLRRAAKHFVPVEEREL